MYKEIKKQWVDALRSGEYEQGRFRLRNPDTNKFCCLGVLCNLHAQAHPEIASQQTDPGRYMGSSEYLPKEVMQWAGFSVGAPEVVMWEEHARTLSSLNDGHALDFLEIAKLIEEQL